MCAVRPRISESPLFFSLGSTSAHRVDGSEACLYYECSPTRVVEEMYSCECSDIFTPRTDDLFSQFII